jgi:hypothetical protein
MLRQLTLTFGSKTKAQEILLLQHNAKPVIRQGFYEHELPRVEQFCAKHNLCCLKSNFKVILADDTSYSNKGLRVPESDKREGMFFVYISKDEQKAHLAAYFELMNNHKDLGLTLGYPSCCANYFTTSFSKNNTNPEHEPKNVWTNLTKRDQDCTLLSHFPCNSLCEESIKLGMKHLDVIMNIDRNRAQEIMETLKVQ